jgi:quercetin dioxygenase-like cupin family protein
LTERAPAGIIARLRRYTRIKAAKEDFMRVSLKFGLAALATLALAGPVFAESLDKLLHGGAMATTNAPPDPSHIPFSLPKDIKWTGSNGEYTAMLFGDPNKAGIYGQLIRWEPGHNSKPHFHSQDRFIYVVSGTWWVSSSTHYDPKQTYPMPQGSFVTDLANTVHWDGARVGGPPAILELVGMGPVKTIQVDENGKPLPPRQPAAAR